MRPAISIILPFASITLAAALGGGCSTSPTSPPQTTSGSTSGSASGSTGAGSGASGTSTGPCPAGSPTTTVHFSTDLMPIFQGTCAAGGVTCHGDSSVAATGFAGGSRQWFGPPPPDAGILTPSSPATLMMIYAGFVNVISTEDLTMKVVNPGDPTTSYLWYKINNKQNMFDVACRPGDFGYCGPQMPSTTALIPQAQRNLICSWIAQGAPDN